MIDIQDLLILIDASKALDNSQKQWLKAKVPTMEETKKIDLFHALEKEQQKRKVILSNLLTQKKEYELKRTSLTYKYIERKVSEEEQDILSDIDNQLAAL